MKKKILTQIMVLSFALGGLFVVGNNVYGFSSSKACQENSSSRSACAGQAGIEMVDANGNCFCLFDPEPDSNNICPSADTIIVAPRNP